MAAGRPRVLPDGSTAARARDDEVGAGRYAGAVRVEPELTRLAAELAGQRVVRGTVLARLAGDAAVVA
jgi:hypothetical protein